MPGCGRNLLDGGGMLSACELGDDGLRVQLQLAFPAADIADTLQQQLTAKLKSLIETETVQLEIQWKIGRARTQGKLRSLPEVGNIIAVGSAKGGVGKSTVAVNIALALRSQGARVGILDADIHGPSQQVMLGVDPEQRPQTVAPNSIIPMEAHGIQSISMGFLLGEKQPLVWRGPMVSGALPTTAGADAVEGTGLSDYRYAARHRGHPADVGPEGAGFRRGYRDHATAGGLGRRQTHRGDVPQGRGWDIGHRREHEQLFVPPLRALRSCFSIAVGANPWPPRSGCRCSAACLWTSAFAVLPTKADRSWWRSRRVMWPNVFARSPEALLWSWR